MFVEQGMQLDNKFRKYLFGSVLLFGASFVGQLPFLLIIFCKIDRDKKPYPNSGPALMHFLEPNTTLFLLLLSSVFVFIGMYLVLRFLHRQTLMSILSSREKLDWNRIVFSFFLWAGFTIGSTLLLYFLNPTHFEIQFQPLPFLILFAIGLIFFPFQIACEELIFRGYLMQGFANLAHNKWFPLLMTSAIFGVLHIANPEVDKLGNSILIFYIGTGLFLGIITLMDEGIELALGFHFANNFVGALLVSSDWSAFKTYAVLKDVSNTSTSLEVILPVLIFFPILLTLFSHKYKWENWKTKLTGKINHN